MKNIVKNSFYQLLIIYSILVLIIYFGFISKYSLQFQIFALILAVMGMFSISSIKEEKISKKLHLTLFSIAILFIIILRVIPYLNNNVPLGYDAGIYKYAIEHGLERNDSWIVTGPTMEPAFLYLMEPLKLFFSSDFIIKWIFILSTVILGISIYYVSKVYFGKTSAIISLLFYSVSFAQFLTFTFMYFRNVLGLTLMLFSIAFLGKYKSTSNKKFLYSFIILAGILGAMHRSTFFMFGLSYFFYIFYVGDIGKSRYDFKKYFTYVLYGVIILVIALSFYIGRFWPAIIDIIKPVATSFVQTGESPGTFIDFKQYQFSSLAYLPFAFLGLLFLLKNRKINLLVILGLVNLSFVYFQLFFFNRFIINLDIILIIFAGLGSSLILQERKWLSIISILLLTISSAYLVYQESIGVNNPISKEDISLIQSLSQKIESDAIIMSFSSEYSPLVLAYSNRTIIAPGLFDENLWSESEWREFWDKNDMNRTIELMSRYDTTRPIYLYTGSKTFNNPCFTLFLQENSRSSYAYTC